MKTPTANRNQIKNELGYTFNQVFSHISQQLIKDKRKLYGAIPAQLKNHLRP
jgi:hypothetical protein